LKGGSGTEVEDMDLADDGNVLFCGNLFCRADRLEVINRVFVKKYEPLESVCLATELRYVVIFVIAKPEEPAANVKTGIIMALLSFEPNCPQIDRNDKIISLGLGS
jgi:hypothetical protein